MGRVASEPSRLCIAILNGHAGHLALCDTEEHGRPSAKQSSSGTANKQLRKANNDASAIPAHARIQADPPGFAHSHSLGLAGRGSRASNPGGRPAARRERLPDSTAPMNGSYEQLNSTING